MRPNIVTAQLRGLTDLTVLAAVKEGFVEGAADNLSYLKRLDAVLRTLNAARLASSESVLQPSPFPDSVGRFRIIHFFRFAIVKPDAGGDPTQPGRHKLLLNVTFDGGWEPYIRVIWRDLGSLLDLLYCNCEGYPPARLSSFDSYAKWIRANEVQSSFFYADSTLSSSDQRYLARAEAIQSKGGDSADVDVALAKLALESAALATKNMLAKAEKMPDAVAQAGLRALRGFLGLAPLFPGDRAGDNGYLLRFTQDVLKEFHDLAIKADSSPGWQALAVMKKKFAAEFKWFLQDRWEPKVPTERLTDFKSAAAVQGGILNAYQGVTHGCIALVWIDDPAKAMEFFRTYNVSADQAEADQGIFRNIAFTFRGFGKLGVKQAQLDKFPQEFFEGMEARAGLLGDVRTNHPTQWRRPPRNWTRGAGRTKGNGRIELSTVHLVAQFRVAAEAGGDPIALLEDQVKQLEHDSGLQVLSIQHMRSYLDPQTGKPREQFGFLDGLSQPVAADSPQPEKKDEVKRGEILLGYGNDRGDGPTPAEADALLDNGSFLVVRKLRQHVDRLNKVLQAQASELNKVLQARPPELDVDALKAKMMGRTVEGDPLAAPGSSDNRFDYANDAGGSLCPFQSHVRRANPREPGMPRILRRGMSFDSRGCQDSEDECGVVFMAYNASIAEQFEVIQRWISGGNSSGILSAHSDPFVGVPEHDGDRIFRFVDGQKVLRVNLGKEPFVELDWGLYLFVPSIDALKDLARIVENAGASAPAPTPGPAVKPSEDFLRWQRLLEDKDRAQVGWAQVRAAPQGALQTDYGLLVGSKEGVLEVFKNDGKRYSVCGYGERMTESIGLGYLGMDPDTGHRDQSPEVNAVIAGVTEDQAFDAARGIAAKYLEDQKLAARSRKPSEATITTSALSDHVMAQLCTLWFGLPDGDNMVAGGRDADPDKRLATCPAHFYSAARLIFSPRPSDKVAKDGKDHGARLLEAAKKSLAISGPRGTLAPAIKKALEKSLGSRWNDGDLFARTLVGIMQGFPPTVDGNLRSVLGTWLNDRRLWDFQVAMLASADPAGHATAYSVLRKPLLETMGLRPVPDMLWRTAKGEAASREVRADNRVVVGIVSALRDGADEALMFGGELGETPHACPGRDMATGVMLGTISALLAAGTIRPTGSPLTFTLLA